MHKRLQTPLKNPQYANLKIIRKQIGNKKVSKYQLKEDDEQKS